MKVSTKALRTHAREILDCVDRGESVTITYRGKPRAKLLRIKRDKRTTDLESDTFPAFGMWEDREDMESVDAYLRDIRKGRFHADRH